MITLEKLLTELKAESLNEIVAGCGKHGNNGGKGGHGKSGKGGKGGKNSHSSRSSKSMKSASSRSYGCGCPTPPPTGCQ